VIRNQLIIGHLDRRKYVSKPIPPRDKSRSRSPLRVTQRIVISVLLIPAAESDGLQSAQGSAPMARRSLGHQYIHRSDAGGYDVHCVHDMLMTV